MDLVFQRL